MKAYVFRRALENDYNSCTRCCPGTKSSTSYKQISYNTRIAPRLIMLVGNLEKKGMLLLNIHRQVPWRYMLGTQLAIINIWGPCPARLFKTQRGQKNATFVSGVLINREAILNLSLTILIHSPLFRNNTVFHMLFPRCFATCFYTRSNTILWHRWVSK